MALSLLCDCCLGQALVPCAICVLMGLVIPGGVQGAQHSGGAAVAGLVSMMLAGSLETLHILHMGTCRAGVTHPCLRTAPASACTSVTEQNALTAELLTFPVLLLFCSAGGRNKGPGCAGRTGSREPLCVVLEGWLNSSGQHTSLQFHCPVPQKNPGLRMAAAARHHRASLAKATDFPVLGKSSVAFLC